MQQVSGATTEGTQRYRDRFPDLPQHFRLRHTLHLSSIGIGTYLGELDADTDARYVDCIKRALQSGINVIDTAINYRGQRSERNIGQALAELFESAKVQRDEIVIATKGGFIPFEDRPPADLQRYIDETFVKTRIAASDDFVDTHCMSPDYLWHQIEQSRQNLGIDCIDIFYLHNPETQLDAIPRKEFRKRIETAFRFLEDQVLEGRIQYYGTATWNGYRTSPKSRDYLSIDDMMSIARKVRGINHRFRFIQLPFNLALLEALTGRNQRASGEIMSTLEAMRRLGGSVMCSASLFQTRLLGQIPEALRPQFGNLSSDAQRAIQFVRSAPGVVTALVGMGRVEHVDENAETAKTAPLDGATFKKLFAQRFA